MKPYHFNIDGEASTQETLLYTEIINNSGKKAIQNFKNLLENKSTISIFADIEKLDKIILNIDYLIVINL